MPYNFKIEVRMCPKKIPAEKVATMAEDRTEVYTDDNGEGHVDTRGANFQCENPDKHLGCNLGIDVAG